MAYNQLLTGGLIGAFAEAAREFETDPSLFLLKKAIPYAKVVGSFGVQLIQRAIGNIKYTATSA